MIHACASAIAATGAASGLSATIPPATAMNGTTWAVVMPVHSRASCASLSASTRRRQWTAASSGRASAKELPAGDRRPHDHEVGVDRQLAHHLGLARAGGDDAVVAAVELLPERFDGGLDGLGILGAPLGQRGVAGLVHADESCHAPMVRLRTTAAPTFASPACRR